MNQHASIQFAISERDLPNAEAAVRWIVAGYPDICAALESDALQLSSAARTAAALRLITKAALATERAHAASQAGRASLLEDLIR
jgi:hypothetical protein